MKFGIVVFPGSNCDADTEYALGTVLGADAQLLWHAEETVDGVDCVVLPGGFAYGDYLAALGWDKTPPGPELPPDVVADTTRRYLDAYRLLTGRDLDEEGA